MEVNSTAVTSKSLNFAFDPISVTGKVTIQVTAQLACITGIGFHRRAVFVPVPRSHYEVLYADFRQRPMQDESKAASFVATHHTLRE